MAQTIDINSVPYEFNGDTIVSIGSAELKLPNIDLPSIVDITNLGHTVDRKQIFGNGQFPLAVSKGPVKPKQISMTFYTAVWESIVNAVGFENLVGDNFMTISFTLNKIGTIQAFNWTITAAFTDDDVTNLKVGSDAVYTKVQMLPLSIERVVLSA